MKSNRYSYFISLLFTFSIIIAPSQNAFAGETERQPIQLKQDGVCVAVSINNTPFFTYQGAQLMPPKGMDSIYARSGFIHPLRSPAGIVLTEAFPPDHPHQHAVFSAWTRARVAGSDEVLDFWNQADRTGNVRHAKLNSVSEKDLSFSVDLEQIKTDGTPIIRETWNVQVVPHPTFRIFDISIYQTPANTAVELLEYHYGGFAFRGRSIWSKADKEAFQSELKILTNNGETNLERANLTRCSWFAAYGKVQGATAGVVIMNHPSSIRYPQPVRIHPEMPYFVFTPVALGEMEISKDRPYQSFYRVMTFDGQPDSAAINAVFERYTQQNPIF